MKIVFLMDVPFSQRDYDRFGIDFLIGQGFQVEVWEVTPLTRPRSHGLVAVQAPSSFSGYRFFSSREQVQEAVRALNSSCVAINLLTYGMKSLFVFQALSKAGIPYCVYASSLSSVGIKSIKDRVANILSRWAWDRVVDRLFRILPHRLFGVDDAAYGLAFGGVTSVDLLGMRGNKTKIIQIHSLDFDLYRRFRDLACVSCDKIAVFLDEYMAFHPDFLHMGMKFFVEVEEYYSGLRNCFTRFEKETGFEVVIAAHPRSRYEDHPDLFGGRSVIRGRTVELVQKAQAVLMHFSTSVNFAVLFRKPLVFLTSESLKKSLLGPYIENISKLFSADLINVDELNTYPRIFQNAMKSEAYEAYQHQYIKMRDSPDAFSWEIFSNCIKKDFGLVSAEN